MSYTAYLSEVQGYLKRKNVRNTLIILLIAGAGIGGFYANKYFSVRRQGQAVTAFEEAMHSYYEALQVDFDWSKKDEKAAWSEVELAFETGYDQNSSSSFAPFFLVYSARALAAEGKHQEAVATLDKALGKMSECSPFYGLYKVVRASIKIDGGDSDGAKELEALASDDKNSFLGMAKYYLAQYYLSQDKNDEALKIFKDLAATKTDSKDGQANWASLAKEYV